GHPALPIRVAGSDGETDASGGKSPGGHSGALEMGHHQRLHGGIKQCLQRHQTQSPWLPFHRTPHYHALLHRRQTSPPSILNAYSTENSEEPFTKRTHQGKTRPRLNTDFH